MPLMIAINIIFGLGYLVDCRVVSSQQSSAHCWITAGAIAGVGGAGTVGYRLGYNTYNPALRDPRGDSDAQLQPRIESTH